MLLALSKVVDRPFAWFKNTLTLIGNNNDGYTGKEDMSKRLQPTNPSDEKCQLNQGYA